MIDISNKEPVVRTAVAEGFIKLKKDTIYRIKNGQVEKGDVISVAKVAGILAAKKTAELLPMCHPIPLELINVDINVEESGIRVTSEVKAHYKTGVEMEALTAVSVALLTIWDMVKKYEKDNEGQYPETIIQSIRVIKKTKSSS
ncbi:cyclic pyranopterin monophosphate synthase MoaC [Acidianus sulfidivorans JP7]|uniref:Probable cyclic pyranopterin monophosphate synthase n=1 Tax=Acidianus sulfidivorans JP7 TaxID=619593 RepID=A0A2U9IM01_9CREN|nr:cyclic pyranopterin monophosphate synthase MoaC [Acidianus sulfidivorans]AWR97041.1 cyclic pyranopterin monophosphate synthase MoaC [Acidianus sulfidivorans JP7]